MTAVTRVLSLRQRTLDFQADLTKGAGVMSPPGQSRRIRNVCDMSGLPPTAAAMLQCRGWSERTDIATGAAVLRSSRFLWPRKQSVAVAPRLEEQEKNRQVRH